MSNRPMSVLVCAIGTMALSAVPSFVVAAPPGPRGRILEAFPPSVQARIEVRDRFLRELLPPNVAGSPLETVVRNAKRWKPGKLIKVAFDGGSSALHSRIAKAASEWAKHGNVKLDFGYVAATNTYRKWSGNDTTFSADIRVSFSQMGYWSFVGTDSVSSAVTSPGEASMNLAGFHIQEPSDWQATTIHEFGHALGFEHEHQHPQNGCDSEFRWENDVGYSPTTDGAGQYVGDPNGKQPGIYTVLGGPPNNWPKSQVDFNLRQLTENSSAFTLSAFDKDSVMKYFFEGWMFVRGELSHCYSSGENSQLSSQDKKGVAAAYPISHAQVERLSVQRRGIGQVVGATKSLPEAIRNQFMVAP